MNLTKNVVFAVIMGALALPVATTSILAISTAPAYAKDNGNRGGNGNGNRGAERPANNGKANANAGSNAGGNRGQGAVRSELKGANASNASPTALAHASDNSRVGQVRLYQEAALSGSRARNARGRKRGDRRADRA